MQKTEMLCESCELPIRGNNYHIDKVSPKETFIFCDECWDALSEERNQDSIWDDRY